MPVAVDAAAEVPAGANQVEAGEGGAGIGPQQCEVPARCPGPRQVVIEGELQLAAGSLAVEVA